MNEIVSSILGGFLILVMIGVLCFLLIIVFKDEIIEIIREIKRKD